MGPTKPSENLFFRGLWGWASTLWERLQSTGGRLHTALHGHDGTDWQKLSLLWGWSDKQCEQDSELNATVTSDILGSSTVPAGEIWIVEAICAVDVTTNIDLIRFSISSAAGAVFIFASVPSAADEYVYWTGRMTMSPGMKIYAYFSGTVAGDDLYLRYTGYKMLIS